MKKFISWRRVSTFKQKKDGLGMEAQRDIIDYHVEQQQGLLIEDYAEVYTGTHLSLCVELRKAINRCKETGATLVIAKCDRLRNAAEALSIYEEMKGNIYFCDAPSQDKTILTIMFAIYEREALNISIRTKAALAAKKKRDGSWAHLYGKNTGTTRESALESARAKRAANQRTSAMLEPNNVAFSKWLSVHQKKYGPIDRHTDIQPLVEEVNALGLKTASGLEFTVPRFRAMLYKVMEFGLVS